MGIGPGRCEGQRLLGSGPDVRAALYDYAVTELQVAQVAPGAVRQQNPVAEGAFDCQPAAGLDANGGDQLFFMIIGNRVEGSPPAATCMSFLRSYSMLRSLPRLFFPASISA